MTAFRLLQAISQAGGRVTADNGDLVLKAARPLPDDLLAELKAHKPELLAELRRPDPVVISLSTPNGPCTVTIPRDQHDPGAFAAFTDRLALIPPTTETDPRRWRSAEITSPDMRTITITTLDGGGRRGGGA